MFDPQLCPDQAVVESLHHLKKEPMDDTSQSMESVIYDEGHQDPMAKSPASPQPHGTVQRTGRWTPDEKILFLYGLKRFGKGRWKKMSVYLPHR